ncbi:DUF402 domain-containing protein [Streptomyces kunmingensis]|uniref:DUF402 domain-containing protein n=1 Tax=Streptomyces kunmingensis TaxID=68225 RepID=A0ABU6CBM5_9ACTN|nr:DUF402 domain-containing protein [Streptomyces kunmingensis]MEB3961280.1 DUF402 domain-containing protein [Streptomyces kunmingensis]
MSAPSTEAVKVRLVKAGRTKIGYPARLLSDDGTHVTVRADWAGEGVRDFGFVRFEPGDVFTEHYWRDRWYAIKEVRSGDGTVKGWYCDITRPAVRDDSGDLVSVDLDLDLWVSADGTQVIRLDEDEFAQSGLAERDPAAAEAATRALDELELLAERGEFISLLS